MIGADKFNMMIIAAITTVLLVAVLADATAINNCCLQYCCKITASLSTRTFQEYTYTIINLCTQGITVQACL